jgi:hypothetical protein
VETMRGAVRRLICYQHARGARSWCFDGMRVETGSCHCSGVLGALHTCEVFV